VNAELICKVHTGCQHLAPVAGADRRFEAAASALPSPKHVHLCCRDGHFTAQLCPLNLPVSSDAPNPFRHLIQYLTMNTKKPLEANPGSRRLHSPDNSPYTTLSVFVLHPVLISEIKF